MSSLFGAWTWVRKQIGRSRLLYGFCPACNSDAPAKDTCSLCKDVRDSVGMIPMVDNQKIWMRFVDSGYAFASPPDSTAEGKGE